MYGLTYVITPESGNGEELKEMVYFLSTLHTVMYLSQSGEGEGVLIRGLPLTPFVSFSFLLSHKSGDLGLQ